MGLVSKLMLGVCVLSAAICAQEVTGSIIGNVVDPSGAAIPNATVVVLSTDRGLPVRTLTTNADGGFVATLLPPGEYTLRAEAKGFKTLVQAGINLHVNDKLTYRLELSVGELAETVTVEANATSVELQSPVAAGLISGTEIRELSLNNRNYIQLISLMPGVTNISATDEVYIGTTNPLGSTNTIPFSISGGRNSGSNFMVDGADNVDRGSNQTLLNYPSVDAIAEFKALRGQYSAEFGRGATGQINVITKSGTNQWHGSAYEFFRNNVLAANSFFNNANKIARPPLRYNDFGYTFSGPIPLGNKNRETNKTFFFWSNEFRRVITYGTVLATLPTADMVNGIFATPVCVERAGSTCLRTSTTISNINPAAQQYIKDVWSKVPQAAPGTSSVFNAQRNTANADQYLIKVDHQFNSKYQISGRWIYDSIPTTEPGGLFTANPIPGVANTSTNSPGKNLTLRSTSTFTPTLYNEGGFSYSYGAIVSNITGLISSENSPDVQIPLPFKSTLGRIPSITLAGGGSGLSGFGPYEDYNRNYNYFDNLTKIWGKHTIKAGFAMNFYQKTENNGGNNAGTFAFTPAVTPSGTSVFNQSWANFLLGDVSAFTQASLDLTPDIHQTEWEAYIQDDIRVTRSFTLNVGLRYSAFYQPWDANNMLTNFDASAYDKSKAPTMNPANGNIIPGTGDPLNGIIVNNTKSPYGSKVSNEDLMAWAPRVGFAWDPFGKGKTAVRAGYGMSYDSTLVGIYEQNIFTNPPFVDSVTISNTKLDNPMASTPSVAASPKTLRGTPLPNQLPYTQQWSFDIQHQVLPSLMISAGYYGSKGTHLLGIVDQDTLLPGQAVAAGLMTPETPLTSATTPRVNIIRPYLGYNAINTVENWFNSNYHALQVNAVGRFGSAGFINVAYTFSKSLTDNSSDRSNAPQNFYARNLEYARATFDRPQVLTISYNYLLPFASKSTGLVKVLAQGWQLSGITNFSSGLPINSGSSLGRDWGGLGIIGSSAAGLRPDMVADPNTDAPHTISQWFNTGAFAAVPTGVVRPGNASPRMIQGPGVQRWDISAFKNFAITEQFKAQFRFEMFNAFNHTNLLGVSASLGSATYGQITSAREPRRIQLALKLMF